MGIFKLPAPTDECNKEWRAKILSKITKNRVIDASFKEQMEKDRFHICEKHFQGDKIETRKKKFQCL